MLESINQYINQLPDIPFNRYFNEYIMAVQDYNIAKEFEGLKSRNMLDVKSMENLIYNQLQAGVVKI